MAQMKAPAQTLADVLAGKDAVMAVNQFCQRFSGKVLSKDDVVFTVAKLPDGHQCTLKLDCLSGVEFAGEVCSNAKDARTSAAQQVLEMYAAEIASMPATGGGGTKNKKKRPASASVGAPAAEPAAKAARVGWAAEGITATALPPNQSNKGDLNMTYSKIIRRSTVKNEVLFNTSPVVGGFQSQVQLPGLPPPWNNEVWAGEVHGKKGDAEQSVAGVALNMIRSDPALMAAFSKPPKPNQWLLNGGMDRLHGKGKGKGKDGKDGPSPQAGMAGIGGSGGWDAQPQQPQQGGIDAAVWQQHMAAAMVASGYPQYQMGATGFSGV